MVGVEVTRVEEEVVVVKLHDGNICWNCEELLPSVFGCMVTGTREK